MTARGLGRVAGFHQGLAWSSSGIGRPLVLLHGGLVDSRVWTNQVASLAAYASVVAYDRRGYGRSDDWGAHGNDLDDLISILDALQLRRPILVGLSYGGQLALDLAIRHPTKVGGLILTSSDLRGVPQSPRALMDEAAFGRSAREGNVPAMLDLCLRVWFDGPFRSSPPVDGDARALAREMFETAIERRSAPRPQAGSPTRHDLARIAVPALVVTGGLDVTEIRDIGHILGESLANAGHTVIAGAGHHLNLERPREFNSLTRAFMESIGQVTGGPECAT